MDEICQFIAPHDMHSERDDVLQRWCLCSAGSAPLSDDPAAVAAAAVVAPCPLSATAGSLSSRTWSRRCAFRRSACDCAPACRCCSTLRKPLAFCEEGKHAVSGGARGMKRREGGNTDLAVLVRLTDVEKRVLAALVLVAVHDGVHRT